ncbi:MAG: hypothetical protein LBC02_07485 [Planctomycetaceae bacterium]|jgi:hypothetical protein|nr:hypothetical protein [Planctomycetaceae bacterium]
MRYVTLICVLQLLLVVIGCSNKVSVSGKVTFTDGTPLTTGEVRFESSGFLAAGKIQSDGNYQLGTISESDGILKGSYKVSIYALDYSHITPEMNPMEVPPAKSLVAEKFCSGETSGLTCVVSGNTKFDIKVEKP